MNTKDIPMFVVAQDKFGIIRADEIVAVHCFELRADLGYQLVVDVSGKEIGYSLGSFRSQTTCRRALIELYRAYERGEKIYEIPEDNHEQGD